MLKMTIGATVSALLLAGIMSLSNVGAYAADNVMKECGADWKAAKAAGTTNGQTWQDFLKDCKAKKEAAAPAAAPAPAPTPAAAATPAPAPKPTPMASATPAMKPKPAATAGEGEFATAAEAKAKCPTETVVWVNLKSHKYHFEGNRSYGTTKKGAYMCEADAKGAGNVAAKDEKPKT